MQKDLLTVALEGPSFSGKTMLINCSKQNAALIAIPEYYELNNGEALAGSNPKRDELGQMEIFFKLMTIECQRQRILTEAISEHKKVLLDRSFFSLICYEYARYGSRETWKKLEKITCQCAFVIPQLILYIDTPADEVKNRGINNGIKKDHIMLNKTFIENNKTFFSKHVSEVTEVKSCTYNEAELFIRSWAEQGF